MRYKYKALHSILLPLWLSLCLSTLACAKAERKIFVIATTSIIGDWVSQIAGDRVYLKVFAGPNTDTHTYEPSPKDAIALGRADLLFENGLGLEYWLPPLYQSINSHAKRITLASHLENLIAPCNSHDHHHSEYDPHVWLDPNNAIAIIAIIASALSHADPANAPFYKKQQESYNQQLKELDHWINQAVQEIPLNRRILITNHDTFSYFARRYGFETLGNIMGSTNTEGVDPSASEITRIIHLIYRHHIPAIFSENIQSATLAHEIAHEAGLPQPRALYIESLNKPSGPASTYIRLMQYNVSTIVESLK